MQFSVCSINHLPKFISYLLAIGTNIVLRLTEGVLHAHSIEKLHTSIAARRRYHNENCRIRWRGDKALFPSHRLIFDVLYAIKQRKYLIKKVVKASD